jgi:CRISPR-associated protein Cas5d
LAYGIRLKVWGDYACFTRPEMKVERVSYDVMTPSAARGILEAIHWKPAIRWVVDAIHVLEPIRFQSIRRNEVGHKAPAGKIRSAMKRGDLERLQLFVDEERQQRAATVLVRPAYVIEAHFELTARPAPRTTRASISIPSTGALRAASAFTSPASAPANSPPISN